MVHCLGIGFYITGGEEKTKKQITHTYKTVAAPSHMLWWWIVLSLATTSATAPDPPCILLALYSGDRADALRAEATWFRPGAGRVAFGFYGGAGVECASPWIQASAFVNVRRAFLKAAECYPRAERFVRINIGAAPAAAEAICRRSYGADYAGRPIRSGELSFASGPDGYALSMEAVRRLGNCTPSAQFDGFEDSGVGECMWRVGVGLTVVEV